MFRRFLFGSFICLLLALVGCADPFEPYWRIDKYRILAVRAEPVTLKPGETADLSVLDHIPEGESVSYEWSWCPVEPSAQQRYECPLKALTRRRDAGMGADVGVDAGGGAGLGRSFNPEYLNLGEGPTAQIPYFGDEEQVLELCKSIQRAIARAGQQSDLSGTNTASDCERGYDISVRVEATTGSGKTEVAKKNLTLWTGGETVNHNPDHGGIALRLTKPSDVAKVRDRLDWVPPADTDRADQWYRVPEGEVVPIVAGVPYDMRAHVGDESVETYRPPPPAGSDRETVPPEKEALTFRWLTSVGTLRDDQRVFAPETNTLSNARRSGWTIDEMPAEACAEAADDGEGPAECRASIYSIVRDGRLGLDYAEADFRIVGRVTGGEQ